MSGALQAAAPAVTALGALQAAAPAVTALDELSLPKLDTKEEKEVKMEQEKRVQPQTAAAPFPTWLEAQAAQTRLASPV